ncbi:MAG: SBBP repeat-containing protein [Rhodothermales bacterium]
MFVVQLSVAQSPTPQSHTPQSPTEWTKSLVSNDYSAGRGITIDTQGDAYISGVYRDDISLGNNSKYQLTNRGKSDIVLIKVSASGEPMWMRNIGGAGEDLAFRIKSDQTDNVFLTGSFERVISFEDNDDTHTLESAGKEDMFLAKFDRDGKIAWSVQSGGTKSDQGVGLAVDTQGNIYVSGFFEETAFFGKQRQVSLTSNGQLDVYVSKYSSEGDLIWARSLGGARKDVAPGIAVNEKGEVFITGLTRGPGSFLNVDADIIKGIPQGQEDLFIARFSQAGELNQIVYAGGRGFDAGNAIDVDGSGNIYVAGYFEEEASLNDFHGTPYIIEGKSFDLFVSKYKSDGSLAWVQTAGGDQWDNAYDISVNDQGDVYVTGLFRKSADFTGNKTPDVEGTGEANAFVARYNTNGLLAGLKVIDGAKSEGASIATNIEGDVFLTGLFFRDASFDINQAPLTSSVFNSFIVKYNAQGFDNILPEDFHPVDKSTIVLAQNYPNPFTAHTSFEFEVLETTQVRLIIHDTLGRVLREIDNGELASGVYRFFYDASQLAHGTYFFTVETPLARITKTMTVIP